MGRSGGCGTGSDACSAVKVCSPRWRPWYRGTCGISVVASLVAERLVAFRFDTRRAGCDSSTLEYRTAELADETADLSHTPCVMCVMAATRRSDARTEVSEVTQHRRRHAYVMRKRGVCRAVPYGFASWWVATGADRGSGPARPPGHAAAFVCCPRPAGRYVGLRGSPDMRSRHTHKYRERLLDLDARRRSGRAGRLGCGGGRPGRGSPGARTLHTRHRDVRVLVGTGRLNAIMSRLRWGPCLLTVCCNVAGHM